MLQYYKLQQACKYNTRKHKHTQHSEHGEIKSNLANQTHNFPQMTVQLGLQNTTPQQETQQFNITL